MSARPSAVTIETGGCRIALRRVDGSEGRECWLLAEPVSSPGDIRAQTAAVYRALDATLRDEGARFASVVWERVHLRSLGEDLAPMRDAREEALQLACGDEERPPAAGVCVEVEQPPIDEDARLVVSVHAVLPRQPVDRRTVVVPPSCPCRECARTRGLSLATKAEHSLYVGAVFGTGEDAEAQTRSMFEEAERLLEAEGMSFHDVLRTWLHVRDIGRDYDGLNRGRRTFFEGRGIDPPPASTGIGGGPAAAEHDLVLGFQATKAEGGLPRAVMSAPTLNEAPRYGADFVRGLRVVEARGVALHLSGTASIDEAGRTACVDDFEAQVDRMLVNVSALLEGQGAGFGDIVSAITYVKRAEDGPRLREKLVAAGYAGFPNAIVVATVCRPDLLCETEALAILPVGTAGSAER